MEGKNDTSQQEDKNRQANIMKRYNALVSRWYNAPPPTKTLLKLLPIFFILAAIPLTVLITQQQQKIRQYAAENGNIIYVSTAGNDSNPGTQNAPFATINKADSVATPGTIVHVAKGTYNQPVAIGISGTESARIVYISDEKWGAKIVGNNSNGSTWNNQANYVDIVGFDISGGLAMGIRNAGNNVRIMKNHIHDIAVGLCPSGGGGIDSAGGSGPRAYTNNHDNEYIGNFINNIALNPCSYVHGIYMSSSNEKAINNILINIGGKGVQCWHLCNSPTISNNLILGSGHGIVIGAGDNGWTSGHPTDNAIVSNNILMNDGEGIKQAGELGSNNQILNNLIYNTLHTCDIVSPTGNNTSCQNTITTNPQFINYQLDGSGDYHLKPTSPAINAGTISGALTTDYDGNARPQGGIYDIGSYEYLISPTPTTTPACTTTNCIGTTTYQCSSSTNCEKYTWACRGTPATCTNGPHSSVDISYCLGGSICNPGNAPTSAPTPVTCSNKTNTWACSHSKCVVAKCSTNASGGNSTCTSGTWFATGRCGTSGCWYDPQYQSATCP